MKLFLLLLTCLIMSANNSFAEDAPKDAQANDKGVQLKNKSEFKSSPKLGYHSNNPGDEDKGLGNLKPLLDQTLGNNKDSSPGGVVMPNAGTYKF
ncbi:hypothetical protein [Desulfovibrio sp. TomC]|uniref:hypothetical protein n=1 Tax=Desulfovibrio sp. TomC TaxID=1562888 RepID=UPI0005BDE10E|nr:hypothetical protein [Desulfovibrio sp. TomC]